MRAFTNDRPLMDSGFPSNSGGGGLGSSGGSGGAGAALGQGNDHAEAKPKIMHTQATQIAKKIDWKRKPNWDGKGATHVRSFHSRLSSEGIELLDQQINQWLEEHPEAEVKLVTTSVGEWQGKVKEPNLIIQVWV